MRIILSCCSIAFKRPFTSKTHRRQRVPHQFSIRQIASQAGVSTATVDRVLHGREGVKKQTVLQVRNAVRELEAQSAQLYMAGRKLLIDVVMDAPERFSTAVRQALETELPRLEPAVFRARFDLHEKWQAAACAEALERIRKRGSHGVILKAADDEAIVAAVSALRAAGIPVVTLVTDLPLSERIAYVGMNNRAAGATAAYLLSSWLHRPEDSIMVVVSNDSFRGEEEREMGFRAAIRQLAPDRNVHYISQSDGLDETTEQLVLELLDRDPAVTAVYSIGGGNNGVVAAYRHAGRTPVAVVGHDLVPENVELLKQGNLNAVIHHDLGTDMRTCCLAFMQFHGLVKGPVRPGASRIEVITPYSLP